MDALSAVTATPKKLSTHVAQLTDDTKDGKKNHYFTHMDRGR